MIKSKPRTISILITAFLVLFASLILLASLSRGDARLDLPLHTLVSETGEYDLYRSEIFDNIFTLHGGRFYPGVYLTPSELGTATNGGVSEAQFGTLVMDISKPGVGDANLMFVTPGDACRVYLDGELAESFGAPGATAAETTPGAGQFRTVLTGETHTLVIHVASFSDGGKSIGAFEASVSAPGHFKTLSQGTKVTQSMIIGGLVAACILSLGLFFANRRQMENLLFALGCFALALREGIIAKVWLAVFPDIRWGLWHLRLEYLALCAAVPLLAAYFQKMFPGSVHKPVRIVTYSVFSLYGALVLFTEYSFFRTPLIGVQILMLLLLVYLIVRMAMRLAAGQRELLVSFAGVAILVVAGINDLVYYTSLDGLFGYGIIGGSALFPFGMLLFAMAQLMAIFIGNVRQMSEAKVAERRLSDENAMLDRVNQLKTEFLSNVAHELKTPLTVMSVIAQDSKNELDTDTGHTELSDRMRTIASEADRLGLMVTQVLDIARIEEDRMTMNLKPCRIDEIIQTTVSTYYPLLKKNDNILILTPCDELPEVFADSDRVSQILVNLLQNAIRHTREGQITVSADQTDGFIRVSVADTGEGIAPERLPVLFERFKSRDSKKDRAEKDTGTGLGLYICKHIAEAHGGEITVESEPGSGTKVSFTLPVYSS